MVKGYKDTYEKLGALLRERELVTETQLDQALEIQKKTREKLGEVLVRLGWLDEREKLDVLARQLNIPPFNPQSLEGIDPAIIQLVPEYFARRYSTLPLGWKEGKLRVAMADPQDVVILDDLKRITKVEISPLIGLKRDIEGAINNYYQTTATKGMEDMVRDLSEVRLELEKEKPKEEVDLAQLRIEVDDAPVVKLVNLIIAQAISDRASDIHIEPQEDSLSIRYRIDGVLYELISPPKHMQMAVISRLKILSEMDIAERRLPQDGSLTIRLDHREIDIRVSTLPTIYGEKVVLRLLEKEAVSLHFGLEDLGFELDQLKIFKKYIYRPYGMILITGPTGSGKSTTLYTVLNMVMSPTKNVVTVEDPVEYRLKGIQQVQARPEIGLDFAHTLRSILRQDPDILMVGEIRDLETAQMAIRSSLTGHLVLSTLHTNDAVGTIVRLINLGIEPFLVTSAVTLAAAQRLVRQICPHCKESYKPSKEVLENLGLGGEEGEEINFYRGRGCKNCRNSGYFGRIALFEVFEVLPEIREMVLEGKTQDLIKKRALEMGMITLRQSGITKVLQGITTVEEVLSTCIEE